MTLRSKIAVAVWELMGKPGPLVSTEAEPSAIDILDLTKSIGAINLSRVTYPGRWPIDVPQPALLGEYEAVNPGEDVTYSVAGRSRKTPWPRRKKELEASARKKRQLLESLREEA